MALQFANISFFLRDKFANISVSLNSWLCYTLEFVDKHTAALLASSDKLHTVLCLFPCYSHTLETKESLKRIHIKFTAVHCNFFYFQPYMRKSLVNLTLTFYIKRNAGIRIYSHTSWNTNNLLWPFLWLGWLHPWPNCETGIWCYTRWIKLLYLDKSFLVPKLFADGHSERTRYT